jgi:hypothetical protein
MKAESHSKMAAEGHKMNWPISACEQGYWLNRWTSAYVKEVFGGGGGQSCFGNIF